MVKHRVAWVDRLRYWAWKRAWTDVVFTWVVFYPYNFVVNSWTDLRWRWKK